MIDSSAMSSAEEAAGSAELAARLRSGDPAAFEMVVRLHGGMLLAVARRILGHEQDARDAVQDALLSAYRGRASYDGAAQLSTWLYRIAVNAALMKLRSRKRKPERSIGELLPRFLADGHQEEPAVAWTEDAAELERAETRQAVREAIAELPETYRTVLLMRDIEELDTLATAQALGVTEGVVKTRLHRARLALRTILDARFREVRP